MAMSDRFLPLAHTPERATSETALTRAVLIAIALLFLAAILFLPLVTVFLEALRKGWGTLFESFSDPDTLAAVRLTLIVAAIAVPFNAIVGLAASWAIAKFEFKGKNLLLTLIDLPFSISPVISISVISISARTSSASPLLIRSRRSVSLPAICLLRAERICARR